MDNLNSQTRQMNTQDVGIEQKIVKELHNFGFNVDHVEDLYLQKWNYKTAIPILLKWLPKTNDPILKESIVRALSVRWAKGETTLRLLIEEYKKEKRNLNLCWVIGSAIEVVADKSVQYEIIDLIRDKEYGYARKMLVLATGKMDKSVVEPILLQLLEEKDLEGHVINTLGKLKSCLAIPLIERYLDSKNSWLKKEARQALRRIG